MSSMGMRGTDNRKTYAVRRWLQALDRLLTANSLLEKEYALHWSNAWSTAYLGRLERRRSESFKQGPDRMERRLRNRF